MAFNLVAIVAMAFTLLAMASNLVAIVAMACTLLAMASNLVAISSCEYGEWVGPSDPVGTKSKGPRFFFYRIGWSNHIEATEIPQNQQPQGTQCKWPKTKVHTSVLYKIPDLSIQNNYWITSRSSFLEIKERAYNFVEVLGRSWGLCGIVWVCYVL